MLEDVCWCDNSNQPCCVRELLAYQTMIIWDTRSCADSSPFFRLKICGKCQNEMTTPWSGLWYLSWKLVMYVLAEKKTVHAETSKRSYLAVMKSSSNCHKEYNTHTFLRPQWSSSIAMKACCMTLTASGTHRTSNITGARAVNCKVGSHPRGLSPPLKPPSSEGLGSCNNYDETAACVAPNPGTTNAAELKNNENDNTNMADNDTSTLFLRPYLQLNPLQPPACTPSPTLWAEPHDLPLWRGCCLYVMKIYLTKLFPYSVHTLEYCVGPVCSMHMGHVWCAWQDCLS